MPTPNLRAALPGISGILIYAVGARGFTPGLINERQSADLRRNLTAWRLL